MQILSAVPQVQSAEYNVHDLTVLARSNLEHGINVCKQDLHNISSTLASNITLRRWLLEAPFLQLQLASKDGGESESFLQTLSSLQLYDED